MFVRKDDAAKSESDTMKDGYFDFVAGSQRIRRYFDHRSCEGVSYQSCSCRATLGLMYTTESVL